MSIARLGTMTLHGSGMLAAACLLACGQSHRSLDIQANSQASPEGRVVINLPAGRTILRAPIVIPPDAREVTIEGNGLATLVGGIVIDEPSWRSPDENIAARLPAESRTHARVLELPAALLDGWEANRQPGLIGPVHTGHVVEVVSAPTELFVGGNALIPARWPNDGWTTIERIVDVGSVPRETEGDIPLAKRSTAAPRGGVFVPRDRSRLARWANAEDLWLAGYWNWDWSEETLPIAKIDIDAGAITLAMPHRYGLAERGKFYLTNALEELDQPGECWIDRAGGRAIAWLPEGSEHAPVTISMLDVPMIAIPSGRDAPRVRIRGVRFESTRASGIVGENIKGAEIIDCSFHNIGTRAVMLSGSDCVIARCEFIDIGGIGVSLAGGERETLTASNNRIEDCTFVRCGRLQRSYNPAILLSGVGNSVLRNEISDLPHFAIQFSGNEHRIEANHIHHVVQETGDAGAIYVGRDFATHGTILRGNLVHDIAGTDARYQNAFYLDDMTSGIVIEHNMFIRCNWGILVGGGRDNVVRDNAFVACGMAVMYDARGVGWMASAFEDPTTSTILQRLKAIPIDREPWSSRYPLLQSYLTDRFARPVGGRVENNALLASKFGKIEDRACVQESGTVVLEPVTTQSLEDASADLVQRVRAGEVTIGSARLGPVGPAQRRKRFSRPSKLRESLR